MKPIEIEIRRALWAAFKTNPGKGMTAAEIAKSIGSTKARVAAALRQTDGFDPEGVEVLADQRRLTDARDLRDFRMVRSYRLSFEGIAAFVNGSAD